MNFFSRKKKQEDIPPASSPPTSASASANSRLQRGPSVNGIAIPPRANSAANSPNPSPGPAQFPPSSTSSHQGQQPQQQAQGQPAQGQGGSPRNLNPDALQQQQQQHPDQQQQQFYQPQAPYQQQQQQQQQQPRRDSDAVSLNSSMLSQQQQAPSHQQMQQQQQQLQSMHLQGLPSGSYGNDSVLVSQSLQYPSYQDQAMHSGGMNGGYDGYGAGQHNGDNMGNSVHQDGYYGQQGASGYDNSNSGPVLTSGPLQLPGQGNAGNSNGSLNGTANGSDSHSGSIGAANDGTADAPSTDVRKLQDEVLSWKKSQETSQAKVNQLRQTLTQKSQENRELHASLTQVTQDRLMLQELVHKREKEMDDLRSKYLNDVRQIRATDDDHSTIEQRVRMLQAAILQLTKSSSGDRAVNLNQEEAQHLVKKKYKFGNTQPYILNMFLEKYIMDSLLEEVFHCPFYVGFSLAKEYGDIHKWMTENNFADQAVRFRQQLCFMSAKAPVAQAHAAQEAARIAKTFEVKLERLYNNWTGHQKVLDLVSKAIELSLTMRSQNAEIMAQIIPSETEFDAEKMVPAHKSKEGGKVKVCVMPCFVDTNGVVVGKAKVFCG